jgi:hypothetical protein
LKLSITRSQSKGFTGGVSFEVKVRLLTTQEEADLIKTYRLSDQLVTFSHKKDLLSWTPKAVTIRDIVNGNTFKAKDLTEVFDYTNTVEEVAEKLLTYIEVARKFGGEEIIDIKMPLDA